MAQRIILVGGIADDHDRDALIARLKEQAPDFEWEWHKTVYTTGHQLPLKILYRLTGELPKGASNTQLVLLRRLNKNHQRRLMDLGTDPVRVETDFATGDELIQWLLSPDAGLVPPRTWEAEEREAALFCVFAKLLKDKSWNKDMHGHAWTQEVHLLNDAPVNVPENPEVRREATAMLMRMEATLLLTKGGSKTPKEWCIRSCHLAAVKKAFLQQRLAPLDGIAELKSLLTYVREGQGRRYQLDNVIQVERVRAVCREPARMAAEAAKPK